MDCVSVGLGRLLDRFGDGLRTGSCHHRGGATPAVVWVIAIAPIRRSADEVSVERRNLGRVEKLDYLS
jgi:hypothetical protein